MALNSISCCEGGRNYTGLSGGKGRTGPSPYEYYRFLEIDTLADLGVGVLLAGVWMAPYVIFPSIRPEDVNGGFDPEMLGVALAPAVMALRFVAYAGVTPVFEELFMRSFVIFFKPDAQFCQTRY